MYGKHYAYQNVESLCPEVIIDYSDIGSIPNRFVNVLLVCNPTLLILMCWCASNNIFIANHSHYLLLNLGREGLTLNLDLEHMILQDQLLAIRY